MSEYAFDYSARLGLHLSGQLDDVAAAFSRRVMDCLGLRDMGAIEGHPLLSECCQVAVTSLAVVGVVLAVGPQCLPQPVPSGMLQQLVAKYHLLSSSSSYPTETVENGKVAHEREEPRRQSASDVQIRAFIGDLAVGGHLLELEEQQGAVDDEDYMVPSTAVRQGAPKQWGVNAKKKTVRFALEEKEEAVHEKERHVPLHPLVVPLASVSVAASPAKDLGQTPSPMRRARSVPTLLSQGADAWRHNLAEYARAHGIPKKRHQEETAIATGAAEDAATGATTFPNGEEQKALFARSITASSASRAAVLETFMNSKEGSTSSSSSVLHVVGVDDGASAAVREAVTDEHLLQFAALLGEPEAAEALNRCGLAGPWSEDEALLGLGEERSTASTNDGAMDFNTWQPLVVESKAGLAYTAHSHHLRRGLHIYRTRAVLEGLTPAEVRAFHLDDAARRVWDENALLIERVQEADVNADTREQTGYPTTASISCLQKFRTKFPRPMASREYHYARRVWPRTVDGGCYAINRRVTFPGEQGRVRGAVEVQEYVSCAAIRATSTPDGRPATELVTCYFEDSAVRPSIVRMAVPRSLWGLVQRYEAALREYTALRSAENLDERDLELETAEQQHVRSRSPEDVAPSSVVVNDHKEGVRKSATSGQLFLDTANEGDGSPFDHLSSSAAPAARSRSARQTRVAASSAMLAAPRSHRLGNSSWRGGASQGARLRQGTWVKRIVIAAGIGVLHAALPGRGMMM